MKRYDSGGGSWTTATSARNIAIGNNTMGGAMNEADNNVAIGHDALNDLTTGDHNICIQMLIY